ncbi:hypothetical protein EOD23_03525 [Mesorhizobium sp. USDA-HM6]|nr:hypothetical protein EOD23_03525 [Mesorhizobium sp. USDA-HM6]
MRRTRAFYWNPKLPTAITITLSSRPSPCRSCVRPSYSQPDTWFASRPTAPAMIFAPIREGISHNPREFTSDDDLVARTMFSLAIGGGTRRADDEQDCGHAA